MYRKIFKRALDIAGAATVLVISSPVLVPALLAVRLTMGTPVFFRQQRAGRFGEPFEMYKIRTMHNHVDDEGKLLPEALRTPPIGRLLRSLSIDELPSCLNVLRGDMSLVGPRPLHLRYVPRYNEHQRRRLEVAPGITGLAQTEGRNTLSWEDRFDLDVKYVDDISLATDVRVLARTVSRVLGRQDINPEHTNTMTEFWGESGPPQDGRNSRT